MAEVELPKPVDFSESFPGGSLRRLLVVDGVQDPGNLVCTAALVPLPLPSLALHNSSSVFLGSQ